MRRDDITKKLDLVATNALIAKFSKAAHGSDNATVVIAALGMIYNVLVVGGGRSHDEAMDMMHGFTDAFGEDINIAEVPLAS